MTTITTTTTRGITFDLYQFWERGSSTGNGTFRLDNGYALVFFQQGSSNYTTASYFEPATGQPAVTARFTDFAIAPAALDAVASPVDLYNILGNVTFRGGTGDDFIYLGDRHDTIYGADGDDFIISSVSIFAGADNDKLYGGAGDDHLEVRFGRDYVSGGAGTDEISLLRVNGASTIDLSRTDFQAVHIGDGTADLRVQLSSVEDVFGSAFGDRITGSSVANVLRGYEGNDTIDGGRGNDVLDGGFGFDIADYSAFASSTVRLSNAAAQNVGLAGSDRLVSIEGLIGGNGSDVFVGNALANSLDGGSGHDTLNGGAGNDSLLGGSGRDMLVGGLGSDTLSGGNGDDVINGGAGADILVGGANADRFAFVSSAEANGDLIVDFFASQGDRVDLRLIDANTGAGGDQAFAFIGASGFTGAAGQLRYQTTSPNPGTPVFILGDTNGDAQADFQITLQPGFPYPTAGDFLL